MIKGQTSSAPFSIQWKFAQEQTLLVWYNIPIHLNALQKWFNKQTCTRSLSPLIKPLQLNDVVECSYTTLIWHRKRVSNTLIQSRQNWCSRTYAYVHFYEAHQKAPFFLYFTRNKTGLKWSPFTNLKPYLLRLITNRRYIFPNKIHILDWGRLSVTDLFPSSCLWIYHHILVQEQSAIINSFTVKYCCRSSPIEVNGYWCLVNAQWVSKAPLNCFERRHFRYSEFCTQELITCRLLQNNWNDILRPKRIKVKHAKNGPSTSRPNGAAVNTQPGWLLD
jgi:hypothetical protein